MIQKRPTAAASRNSFSGAARIGAGPRQRAADVVEVDREAAQPTVPHGLVKRLRVISSALRADGP
jgi:hypothetical protein